MEQYEPFCFRGRVQMTFIANGFHIHESLSENLFERDSFLLAEESFPENFLYHRNWPETVTK